MSKKLTKDKILKDEFNANISTAEMSVNGLYDNTFWYPQMQEILPMYENYISENPDKVKEALIAFAWHAYRKALKQR